MTRPLLALAFFGACAPVAPYHYELPKPNTAFEIQLRQLNRAWHNAGRDAVRREIKDAFLEAAKAEHLAPNSFSLFSQGVEQGWPLADLDKVTAVFEDVPDGRFASSLQHIATARAQLLPAGVYKRMDIELQYVRGLVYGEPPPEMRWDVRHALGQLEAALQLVNPNDAASRTADPAMFAKTPYPIRMRMARDVLERAANDFQADPQAARGPRDAILAKVRAVLAEVDAARSSVASR